MTANDKGINRVRLPLVAVQDDVQNRQDIVRRRKALEKAKEHVGEGRHDYERISSEESTVKQLEAEFVPAHGPAQIISPRLFFNSPIFRVASKAVPRKKQVELSLLDGECSYLGPELRQVDGLVFMALVNMARDIPAGVQIQFVPEEVCKAIFSRYDGPARRSLRESIQRLQRGLLRFNSFSVQLALRFDYPSHGWWSVALDREIVQLFWFSPQVWLSLATRLQLPEGIATWLYCHVQSQTRLIPTPVRRIRDLCGSEAELKSFTNKLRKSLTILIDHSILEKGASICGGVVRWQKAQKVIDGRLPASNTPEALT